MKTSKLLLVLILLCQSITNVFAQSSVKPGFIIMQTGDTLEGEIKVRNWHKTPETILFCKKDQQEYLKYTANNIQYFEANEERYVSAKVWVDHRPVDYLLDPDRMLPEHSSRMEKHEVFLKILLLGSKYDLLQLTDDQKEHFYLRDSAGKITNLVYRVFSISSNNVAQDFQFRGILKELNREATNDLLIGQAIQECHYDASSLTTILERINNSTGKVYYKYIPNRSREKASFFIGPAGGITRVLVRGHYSGLQSGTGTIAGLIGGVDFLVFRFDVLAGRVQYYAEQGSTQYHILEYNLIPSIKLRCPVVSLDNFQMHIGGGFMFPIVLSSHQKIGGEKFKYPSYVKFPWAGWTAGGHIDMQINKRWETGITCYNAASVDLGSYGADAMHCYVWLAYRFN